MSVAVGAERSTTTAPATVEKVEVFSIRRLMWLRFKRNRLAVFGGCFLIVMYLTALFASFLAPYAVRTTHDEYPGAAPHGVRFFDASGQFHLRPFVYGLDASIDPRTFRKIYTPNPDQIYPVRFFAKGIPYEFLGLIETDYHLFTVEEPGKIFLLGTDRQGRDLFSRILFGAQVSLTVGLVGVLLSLVIGTILGVATGFFGGTFDNVVQRVIEVLLAFPQIPLWLALASLVPPTWSSVQVFFGISVVLSLVNWGGLARQVRGMVYALREEDYVTAARYTNCSNWRIITRHLLPNTLSHVLVVATLSIPSMILGETALSFLGLGIRPPMTSWGLLLNEAQHVRVLLQQPWLLTPAIFVVATIISFNFLGDGLRDAADPFR
ncbi:MAG: ABC transporter permease [Caldilineaceae bacterium]|nr:ABC transporter permease [Caldilineaceae bacterium]